MTVICQLRNGNDPKMQHGLLLSIRLCDRLRKLAAPVWLKVQMSVEPCVHMARIEHKLLLGFSCMRKSKTGKFQLTNKLGFIDFQSVAAVWWLELSPQGNREAASYGSITTFRVNHNLGKSCFLKPLMFLSPFWTLMVLSLFFLFFFFC